ncbi:MAG: hypothetical protein AB8F78_16100 [Saprospiraceae bacterium]
MRNFLDKVKPGFILLASLLLLGSLVTTQSCSYDVEDELYPIVIAPGGCDTIGVTYQGSIVPLLDQNCNNCHGTGIGLGNVFLEPYAEVLPYVTNERLICTILQEGGCSPMPKNGPKLATCEIASIQKWISDGAPNN